MCGGTAPHGRPVSQEDHIGRAGERGTTMLRRFRCVQIFLKRKPREKEKEQTECVAAEDRRVFGITGDRSNYCTYNLVKTQQQSCCANYLYSNPAQ